ncbi:hypothetical protein SAMN00790413_05724 [Deinococcus hopiensis KR-140]|uniref:Uncharacterized protein n=1 Tax=Deinococcus hopiensis KR-140 TaxID=695939 RepID=A0A1W1UD61_9DEIO|nr:hypothetical protein SAMN00790413_05724 [Deinococcus hopiensis KR-140]
MERPRQPATPSVRRWALRVDNSGREARFTQLQDGSGAPATFYRTDKPGKTSPRIGIRGTVTSPQGRSVLVTLRFSLWRAAAERTPSPFRFWRTGPTC